jgi:hypothetical protein
MAAEELPAILYESGKAADPMHVPCKRGAQLRKASCNYSTTKHQKIWLKAHQVKAIQASNRFASS